jgi:hypothetical protein
MDFEDREEGLQQTIHGVGGDLREVGFGVRVLLDGDA